MFHASLFALLTALFLLFAFEAGRAGQPVVAISAALIALWLGDGARRSVAGVLRRRRADATNRDGHS
jgi:hypothetical protein